MPAPDDTSLKWRLFSCLHANMLPLANTKALKEYLTLWLPAADPDPTRLTLNRERIEAIQDFPAKTRNICRADALCMGSAFA